MISHKVHSRVGGAPFGIPYRTPRADMGIQPGHPSSESRRARANAIGFLQRHPACRNSPAAAGTCGPFLEPSSPGCTAGSPAHADVQLDDGLCTLHDVLARAGARSGAAIRPIDIRASACSRLPTLPRQPTRCDVVGRCGTGAHLFHCGYPAQEIESCAMRTTNAFSVWKIVPRRYCRGLSVTS